MLFAAALHLQKISAVLPPFALSLFLNTPPLVFGASQKITKKILKISPSALVPFGSPCPHPLYCSAYTRVLAVARQKELF
jgi:hypothetical protein